MTIIGVPKEIKNHEYRVGMVPSSVAEVVQRGHKVIVQKNAGAGIGCSDQDYIDAGAVIEAEAAAIFAKADMIVKVKEPQSNECAMLRENQLLFTYLHLAPDPEQTKALLKSGCVAIAYETVTDARGKLPLLAPMSEVAGRLSIQMGARFLEKAQGGRGVLMGGVPGVAPADVMIIGAGVVGTNALMMAVGMGARVTVIDRSLPRLRELDVIYGSKINTRPASQSIIDGCLVNSDVIVTGALVVGGSAPKLIKRSILSKMRKGSVIVDVSIDQGGCCETSKATTHQDPVYVVDDVVHYCVANMPGAVPRTSAFALNNATLPFTVALADKGYQKALLEDSHLLEGLNVYKGKLTYQAVSEALDLPFTPAKEALKS